MATNTRKTTRKCLTCNTEVPEPSWDQHLNGKKHCQLLARQQSQFDSAERSIFVTGFPPETSELQLIDYFMKFSAVSKVIWDKDNGRYAIVEFEEKSMVSDILSRKHRMGTRDLIVKQKKPRLIQPKSVNPDQESPMLNEIVTERQLLSEENVDEQIKFLIERFALSKEESSKRFEVCLTLEHVMRRFFPECRVIPYGSCANGLGMLDSDLDIFLDLDSAWDSGGGETNESQKPMLDLVVSQLEMYRTFQDPTFLIKIQNFTVRNMIELLSHIIQKYAPSCKQVLAITAARCPIIKFYHSNSATSCDLSVENGLAVHNTILVRFYQELDPRVYLILFTVRYWAKRKEVCDSKRSRFSSYSISMLVLFYLQNCEPPVLPTVEVLQQLSDDNLAMSNGWLCHFCMDKSKIPKSEKNEDGLEKLLVGFFQFFYELNLAENVLCLRTGKVVDKNLFWDLNKDDEKLSDFRLKTFNVQDPFELNCNITSGVNDRGVIVWIEAIEEAYRLSTTKSTWDKKPNSAWGLAALLAIDGTPTTTAAPVLPVAVATKVPTNSEETFEFDVIINMIAVKQAKSASLLSDEEYVKKAGQIVRSVFGTALKLDCEDIAAPSSETEEEAAGNSDEEPSTKRLKASEGALPVKEPGDRVLARFTCRAYYRTWTNRKRARQALVDKPPLDVLTSEALMSESIIQEAGNDSGKPLLQFICSVRPIQRESQIGVAVQLVPVNVCKEFTALRNFLKSYVPKVTNQAISK